MSKKVVKLHKALAPCREHFKTGCAVCSGGGFLIEANLVKKNMHIFIFMYD